MGRFVGCNLNGVGKASLDDGPNSAEGLFRPCRWIDHSKFLHVLPLWFSSLPVSLSFFLSLSLSLSLSLFLSLSVSSLPVSLSSLPVSLYLSIYLFYFSITLFLHPMLLFLFNSLSPSCVTLLKELFCGFLFRLQFLFTTLG